MMLKWGSLRPSQIGAGMLKADGSRRQEPQARAKAAIIQRSNAPGNCVYDDVHLLNNITCCSDAIIALEEIQVCACPRCGYP